jgi:hypothetical protein
MSQLLCLPLPQGHVNVFHSLDYECEYVLAMHELEFHLFNN